MCGSRRYPPPPPPPHQQWLFGLNHPPQGEVFFKRFFLVESGEYDSSDKIGRHEILIISIYTLYSFDFVGF